MTITCFQIYKRSSPILRRRGSLRTVLKFFKLHKTERNAKGKLAFLSYFCYRCPVSMSYSLGRCLSSM